MPIERRAHTFFAYLDVPADVRRKLKRRVYRLTLKTDSRSIAERRAAPLVAQWKAEIAKARGEPNTDDASFWRDALRGARTEERREAVLHQIEMATWDIGASNVENIGDPPSSDPEARRFHAIATGTLVATTDHLEEWLSTSQATAKTKDMQRADVKRFAVEFKFLPDVMRPEVRRWITALMNDDGLTPKTVQRVLSALRGYWRYLQSINAASDEHEPFDKLDVARQNKRDDPRSARQPFEPGDVVKLWKAAKVTDYALLPELIELAMWSGARIEELCALKTTKVGNDYFDVEDAKTEAGWRRVPIHSKLKRTLVRLVKENEDGYVLSGLTANKYGDRSNAIGKRFGRLKTELGFGENYVFHSIRKTVATMFENADVPENVAADILGHEKPTMTYGLYSGGANLEVKRKAIEKLRYPTESLR